MKKFQINIILIIFYPFSLSSSFGEITFLSLSTFYTRSLSLTGWGSGTGAAGIYKNNFSFITN
jgi:hypothetical protein